ncbi:hypothetical protein CXG81DRAFT_10449, partial [Caulochytrium protostelioides]
MPRSWPDRITDYDVRDLLGRGGFGVVYRAFCQHGPHSGEAVAIKMIDKKRMHAANMTERVVNEVQVHWHLHHPSILSLHEYFEDDETVYLVMELCQRGELFHYLGGRPISEEQIRPWLYQIIEGIEYLHDQGIIHRDLKLANLLLTASKTVKIADFGLAVKMSHPAHAEQKTLCGTPNYISPEIVSRQPYGLASDLWSLGCMFFTLLTGHPPFESHEVAATLERVARVAYDVPDHVSPEAKDMLRRLLVRDPRQRLTAKQAKRHPYF